MPSDFSVVALIAAFNEADIIEHVITDLIGQGVEVYFLDDGSTDDTLGIVDRYVGRGVIGIERIADSSDSSLAGGFAWERILLRKAKLAMELDANWFIHHDADEFRESPWAHHSLKAAIQRVDALGYNAIDSTRFDFWPVHDEFRAGDDVRDAFKFYSQPASYDQVQIRCWKKTTELVDLASSGGHDVRFPGRKVFPLRFILRHYPIRGQAHGERKVFLERRARFLDRERARGWHIQYDSVRLGESLIRDPSTLTLYDPEVARVELTIRHRDVEMLEAELNTLRRDLENRKREMDGKDAELRARDVALADARKESASVAAEVAGLRRELEERQIETDRQLNDLMEEAERLRGALEDGTRRLNEFHSSLSWRCTAPARAVYRLLSGR